MRKNKWFMVLLIASLTLVSCSSKNEDEQVTEEIEESNESRVSFVGVGDNLIHETVYLDALQSDGSYNFSKMYEEVEGIVKSKDIAFINQETIMGGSEIGLSGYPTFNTPSEMAKNLEDVGFNLVNLATNHSLDKSSIGIENALHAISKTSMIYDGIYTSEEDYQKITTFEKNGIVFSFLAYTYGTNGIEPNHSYEISYFDEEQIKKDVAKAKELSDVVIVSAHWGDENTFEPNSFQQYYANLFTELEVDVVIGTHPHTIQPIQWNQSSKGHDTLMIYSLGNFLGGMLSVDNAIGGMVMLDFVKDNDSGKVSVENVKWETVLIHFELQGDDIMNDRYRYQSYPLSQYTDELASKHALNGFEGQAVNIEEIKKKVNSVIDEEFRK